MMQSLSARRAWIEISKFKPPVKTHRVALRKESVDRNYSSGLFGVDTLVALRKESVDRNIASRQLPAAKPPVALRKESVDRNANPGSTSLTFPGSLSARRAWIEILIISR